MGWHGALLTLSKYKIQSLVGACPFWSHNDRRISLYSCAHMIYGLCEKEKTNKLKVFKIEESILWMSKNKKTKSTIKLNFYSFCRFYILF
jgi:hypothetical protein